MKKAAGIIGFAFIAALFVLSATSAEDKSELTALQGTWKGKEIGNDANDSCRLIITGTNIDYRGTDTNDWVKGTITLKEGTRPRQFEAKIADCPNADAIGKTAQVIYKIKDGVLTLAGNAPGNTNVPESFDAPSARRMELKKE